MKIQFFFKEEDLKTGLLQGYVRYDENNYPFHIEDDTTKGFKIYITVNNTKWHWPEQPRIYNKFDIDKIFKYTVENISSLFEIEAKA